MTELERKDVIEVLKALEGAKRKLHEVLRNNDERGEDERY